MALKGIVIDPGHGGSDPGAVSNDIKEKDYTLLISKYMYDRFKELGVPVKLTRDSDITLTPKKRVEKVKSFFGTGKDVIVISNHLNAGKGDGAEVIYALRNTGTLSSKILNEIEKEGQNVRKYYQLRLPSNPIKDYYFIQRDTPNNEALIIEYGFVDSPKDDVNQLKKNYKKYAEAVVRAVCDYKGIKYIPNTSNYYVVQKGDTLWSIAKKYGTTIDKLKELNKLSTNVLKIGQTLTVPVKENNVDKYITYKVVSGDTLWDIAKKYNTTVDTLMSVNNLKNSNLQINQQLFIPKSSSSGVKTYIVKKGDTLWDLANTYGTTVKKIMEANNLSSTILKIGQSLIIPN